MRAPQCRQLPRRTSHDTTGTLSYGRTSSLQLVQRERGLTSDSPRGRRDATTLRNEPIISPNGAASAKSTVSPLRVYLPEAIRHNARRTKGRDRVDRRRVVLEVPRAVVHDAPAAVHEQRPVDEAVAVAVEERR